MLYFGYAYNSCFNSLQPIFWLKLYLLLMLSLDVMLDDLWKFLLIFVCRVFRYNTKRNRKRRNERLSYNETANTDRGRISFHTHIRLKFDHEKQLLQNCTDHWSSVKCECFVELKILKERKRDRKKERCCSKNVGKCNSEKMALSRVNW